ncbi:hypothetical protein GCM10008968_34880 [Bacillus horti]
MYAAKRQNVHAYINKHEREVRSKRKFKEGIQDKLFQAANYVAPTAAKYPLFAKKERDETLLVQAGNPMEMNLKQFYGMRLVVFFIVFFIGWFYFILGFPFRGFVFLISMAGGLFVTNLWIWLKARERQEQISLEMPDFLDTVSVSLVAGASLDGALKHVSEQSEGPLSEEIRRLIRELELGVPRRRAYHNLLKRNKAKELEVLVQALLQGSELGVPVSTTFRVQAEDLRASRGFSAKEKAAKASPKITIVTTMLVVPSIFLFIVGLLFLNFMYQPERFGINALFQ